MSEEIHKGLVAMNASGDYLSLAEFSGHTGTKMQVTWLTSLNKATVFSPQRRQQLISQGLAEDVVVWIPAQSRTLVTLRSNDKD